ncbi:hypothetical protein NHX12_034359 [Muraenolepis orangiensis]|uniref:SH2 domain-containing protein n=1 Tax=Muraenolepis orangiensis TaxID=630683 RepID=A0A9Q0D2U2_9TELE|nr:hypothetical protein NHX12_034359 [Muraenolepis orangiensis]
MGNLMRSGTKKTRGGDIPVTGSEQDVLVVTRDFPSARGSQPLFSLGEKLQVLSQGPSWWKVLSPRTQRENYIPQSHAVRVYHGWLFEGLGRQEAETLLQMTCNMQGSFMVRERAEERGVYSLSVKHMALRHYRIHRMDNSWYYISPGLTFQCLEDMINHYSECADGLCCTLTSPCLTSPCLTSPCLSGASAQQPAPPLMRRNFTWKEVEGFSFHDDDDNSGGGGVGTAMSYGVRHSMATYRSLSGALDAGSQKSASRKKKTKSLYALSLDYDN